MMAFFYWAVALWPWSMVLATGDWQLTVQEVAQTPETPNWQEFFSKLPPLGRKLRLAYPCCGIHGSMAAMHSMGVATDSVNTFDLDDRYEAV